MSDPAKLRGIITERLTAATRDVLAAVEGTVAGYEEAATCFRLEVDRQRKQLEPLQPREPLQPQEPPQVNMLPAAAELFPEEVVLGDEEEEPPPQTTATTHLDPLEHVGDNNQDLFPPRSGVEVPESPPGGLSNEGAEPADGFRPNQEDSLYESPARSSPSKSGGGLRRVITRRLSAATRDVLAAVEGAVAVYEEAAAGFRLEIERQRKLLELLRPQAPEPWQEMLQDEEEVGEEEEQRHLPEKPGGGGAEGQRLPLNDDDDDEETTEGSRRKQADRTDPDFQLAARSVRPTQRRSGRPRISGPPNRLTLRVRLLEDPRTAVLSKAVFQKSSVQDLDCPRGLQESDFLDLLRSSFPRLAAGQPFGLFVAARNRRLQPLSVETVTPEEICSKHRPGGNASVYIRLKEGEDRSLADPEVTKRNDGVLHDSRVEGTGAAETGGHDGAVANEPQSGKKTRTTKKKKKKERTTKSGEDGKMSCQVCGAWYRQLGSLISHVWTHVSDSQLVCGACGERFESADSLTAHLRDHQKVHGCQHCGKTFVSAQSLSFHVAKHTGESRFRCAVCGKAFTNMASLNYHRWLHVEDKPHKCDVCLKAFGLASHLASHKKLHAAEERHVCDVCNRSFRLRRAMTQHRLTHSDDKRYACQVCHKRFKLEGSLRVHSKTHAQRDRAFLCHVCCRTFLWKGTLMAHLKTHGGTRPFTCAVCGKGFWFRCDLRKHARVHSDDAPHACTQCGRRFKQKANLDSHVRIHLGIKRFACAVCGKECSRREHLKVHMRTHNGDKPYKCALCDRAFTQSHCLKTHMKSHQADGSGALDALETGTAVTLDLEDS